MFWKLNARLLEECRIKSHPVTLGTGGLAGVPAGCVNKMDISDSKKLIDWQDR